VRTSGALALLAVGLVTGSLMWSRLLDRAIFQPTPGVDVLPEALGIEAEELFLRAEDGVRLHAFYLPSARASSRALLFLHGNAGNASHRLPNAAQLAQLGVHVLLLDYRGYGRSDGRPSEDGVFADARAGLAYLLEERGFPEERVVLFGRSLGGAVAVDLAQDRPLAGVILESTFPSAASVARLSLGRVVAALVGDRFASDRKIARLRAPLLFLHGDRDRVIPFALGRQLYALAPEPKDFAIIVGAGHNDTTQVGGRPYFERIARFLDRVAPEADAPADS
jgi:fermentation-respiration switch protein FrsA (DUF1100 family)